jgi:lysophospholipase L1-like esterase
METLINIYYLISEYLFTTPLTILLTQAFIFWLVYLCFKGLYYLLSVRLTGLYRQPISFDRGADQSILLIGDSTAVGTGSSDDAKTLSSFLAKDYPNTNIVNKAENGALTERVLTQLNNEIGNEYNLIIISTGGNDVWALTREKKLRKIFTSLLRRARAKSNGRVIVLFFGNEGSAPFFPIFLQRFLLRRTLMIRDLFEEVTKEEQVTFLELFTNPKENPFVLDPEHNFAPDGLHPNGNGYWNWYKHVWLLMSENVIYIRKK